MSSPDTPLSIRRSFFRILAVLVMGLAAASCASGHDEITKELDKMRSEIRELRALSVATQDRLSAIERPEPSGVGGEQSASSRDPDLERPSLEVVRLVPNEQATEPAAVQFEQDAATVSNEPRPMVQANRYGSTITQTRGSGPGPLAGATAKTSP